MGKMQYVERRYARMQRAALAYTACCDGKHNVLCLPSQRVAFWNTPACVFDQRCKRFLPASILRKTKSRMVKPQSELPP